MEMSFFFFKSISSQVRRKKVWLMFFFFNLQISFRPKWKALFFGQPSQPPSPGRQSSGNPSVSWSLAISGRSLHCKDTINKLPQVIQSNIHGESHRNATNLFPSLAWSPICDSRRRLAHCAFLMPHVRGARGFSHWHLREQCFSTTVPQRTGVPLVNVTCAAKSDPISLNRSKNNINIPLWSDCAFKRNASPFSSVDAPRDFSFVCI